MVQDEGHERMDIAGDEHLRASRARVLAALVGTLVVLGAWNLGVRPAVDERYHLPLGLVVAAVVVVLGLWAGLGVSGLGLAPGRLGSGLRWGAAAAGAVAVVLVAGVLLPETHGSFDVARAHVSFGDLAQQLLVVIPLGTVLVEELAFRGTLLGLLLDLLPRWWAVASCSVLFGLWHLRGIVATTSVGASHVALAGLGTVAATAAAGVVFCWLRLRSQSLLAPSLAHLATNTLPLVTAWLVVH